MISWSRILGALIVLVAISCGSTARGESKYIRNNGSNTVIVFVHGVLGDAVGTFTNGKAYWPELLTQDASFNGVDIFALNYPTTLWSTMSVDELAEVIRREMTGHQVVARQNIIFLVHSMGGLIVRSYLLKN